jgi:hypothetical protein
MEFFKSCLKYPADSLRCVWFIYPLLRVVTGSPCGGGLEYLLRGDEEGTQCQMRLYVWLLVFSDLTSLRLHCELQTRPLVREGALQEEEQSNCHYWKDKDKIWSWAPKGSPIPRRTGRLTVGRKINSTQLNVTGDGKAQCPGVYLGHYLQVGGIS